MNQLQARFQLALAGFELDVDFAIPAQGVTALFGPSGSGKTTLLRCLAGLERAAGHCRLQDLRWQDERHFLPPHQRPLGYVFQDANLFPHLSVRANLEYGYRRIPAAQRRVQLDQVVAWLGLEPLLTRQQVTQLSGGERQRVAIGRALLTSPRLLLMDEPLAALDAASKQEILPYLERLHRELDIPLLYVSHALEEVLRLADHLLLLVRGRVLANGPLPDLLARLDLPLARLDDAGVVLQARVQQHDAYYQLSQLQCDGHGLWLNRVPQAPGEGVRVRILARDVSIATYAPQGSSISNILPCRIAAICDESADKILLRLTLGQQSLLARITRRSHDLLALQVGLAVFAQIKSVALMA